MNEFVTVSENRTVTAHGIFNNIWMLDKFYRNENGKLLEEYPSINQFRYFYRKYNKTSKELISRNGLSYYQRNQRPFLYILSQKIITHIIYIGT